MFIEPTITWVPSGFSGYIWLDTKIVLKKKNMLDGMQVMISFNDALIIDVRATPQIFDCLSEFQIEGRRSILMLLYSPVDLTGNVNMIEKLVLGACDWNRGPLNHQPNSLTSAPSRHK